MRSKVIAIQLVVIASLAAVVYGFEQRLLGLGWSFVFTASIVACSTYLLAEVSTAPLRAIAAMASRIGKGEVGSKYPALTDPQVAELARVVSEMAAKTEAQLDRLEAEKNRLDTILRGMGEGIMVADPQGSITLVNPAFKGLFGLCDDVEGRLLIDISRHPALHESFRDILSLRQERIEELQLHSPKETTLLVHWVPLVESGVLTGVVAVFHDISDIRHLEKMRRDFVANVSHELRTPITIIKGYAETLMAGALEHPKQASKFVSIMYSHADRLASLVSDLLTLSQLESGAVPLETRSVRVQDTIEHVVALLEQKIRDGGVKVDLSGLADAPCVMADPGRLEQVFVNLLDNAVKYTPAGGSVTLSAAEQEGGVTIAVQDTGIGIPSKDLPRIFERFYRVDSARSREAGGTGLGLSIVKHIVQLQGGAVSVQSSGHGSTFFVTLNRAEAIFGDDTKPAAAQA